MDDHPRRTLTVDEFAKALGIGRNQAYEAIKRGEIPAIKIGKRRLVSLSVLDRMIEEGVNPIAKSLVR